jgi:hypothetical protein
LIAITVTPRRERASSTNAPVELDAHPTVNDAIEASAIHPPTRAIRIASLPVTDVEPLVTIAVVLQKQATDRPGA